MGIFDRIYYGKAGKADYTPENLPRNRFQLFGEVLRVRVWSLVRVNLMQVLFWLPLIFWTYMNILAIQGAEVTETGEIVGGIGQVLGYVTMYLIGLIPCITITGPSSAAAAYVTRNWARDQHSFIWSDFKDAFKDNWKQALGVSAITSVVPLLAYVGYQFYGEMAQTTSGLFYAAQVLVLALCLVWLLMLPMLYPLMVGYKLTFGQLLRNAALLALGRFPQIAAIRLLLLIPTAVLVMGILNLNMWMIIGAVLYYMVFGLAFSRLVYASLANGIFDKFINPKIDGATVGQGLYQGDGDDDDEEDEDEDDEE